MRSCPTKWQARGFAYLGATVTGQPTTTYHQVVNLGVSGSNTAREGKDIAPALMDASVHPTQVLYDEVGAMILDVLDQRG